MWDWHTFGIALWVSHGTDHDVSRAQAVGSVRDWETCLANHLLRLHHLKEERKKNTEMERNTLYSRCFKTSHNSHYQLSGLHYTKELVIRVYPLHYIIDTKKWQCLVIAAVWWWCASCHSQKNYRVRVSKWRRGSAGLKSEWLKIQSYHFWNHMPFRLLHYNIEIATIAARHSQPPSWCR